MYSRARKKCIKRVKSLSIIPPSVLVYYYTHPHKDSLLLKQIYNKYLKTLRKVGNKQVFLPPHIFYISI